MNRRRMQVDRLRPASTAGDPRKRGNRRLQWLEEDRDRLRTLADDVVASAEKWSEPLGADIVELAEATGDFLRSTAPDVLVGLHRVLRSGSPSALEVVRATSDAIVGVERLDTVVGVVGAADPTPEQAARLDRALVDAAQQLCDLGYAVWALGSVAPQRPWAGPTVQLADDFIGRLKIVIERRNHGEAASPEPSAALQRSAEELGAALRQDERWQRWQFWGFRAFAIGILLAIAAGAYLVLWHLPTDATSLVLDLAKLATAIPLALLAAYLQKEAARHRERATWLAGLKLQLLHVDRYFPAEEQNARRAEIWQRWALGPPGAELASSSVSEDLAALLERVAELIKSVGSIGRG